MASIKELYQEGIKYLEKAAIDSAKLDAGLLLRYVTNLTLEEFFLTQNDEISSQLENSYYSLLQMRAAKIPVSHLVGKREFFGHIFVVNSNVLDPRADSETLVEQALKLYRADESFSVLELGVGSGCLILSILHHYKNAKGVAVDISQAALNTASINASNLSLTNRVEFVQSDWCEKIDTEFDLVISNPPYIKLSDKDNLQDEVKLHEPHLALFGGDSGLDCYEQISVQLPKVLKIGGYFLAEIGQNQEQEVIELFVKNSSLELVKEVKDLAGIIRILIFKRIR